ncbi:MAG: dienelactone hydrolase family protein [Anaerolineae bacterium]|nr:dienelactone hydrolase family protein [Anaerolineae bacterium]
MVEELHTTAERLEISGVPCRVRVPQREGAHPLLLMLHGYEGDEDVTWIFSRAASAEWLIASPRAPLNAPTHGYSWFNFQGGKTDPVTLQAALGYLESFIAALKARYSIDDARIVMLGFSQGASMAYAYMLSEPTRLRGVVSLGGFIPGYLTKQIIPPLNGIPVLILHGTQDEVIAVEIARKNRDLLIAHGAQVTYFEEAVGHRVGAGGMRLLTQWLAARL